MTPTIGDIVVTDSGLFGEVIDVDDRANRYASQFPMTVITVDQHIAVDGPRQWTTAHWRVVPEPKVTLTFESVFPNGWRVYVDDVRMAHGCSRRKAESIARETRRDALVAAGVPERIVRAVTS